jgi:hypothetical protein
MGDYVHFGVCECDFQHQQHGKCDGIKDAFWNNMFEKELPKYKDRFDTIFSCHLFEAINVNIIFGHVFSHL